MKIAIDASRAVNETAGVGRYTKLLIQNLLKIDQKNEYRLFFNFVSNFSEKKKLAEQFKTKNSEIIITKIPGRLKEKLLTSRIGFYRGKLRGCDIFLAPTFLEVDLSVKIPQVVVIHDLTMFLYPKLNLSSYFQKRTKLACDKAREIITISDSTKKDLIQFLKLDEKKINVIYPGITKFDKIASFLPADLKAQSYILAVGTIEPRKNLNNLFKAYHLLPENLKTKYPLAVVGAVGWGTQELFEEIKKSKDKIIFLGYQSDEVLAKLYQEAKVFVYPSFYEGFGFPIIEAMQFGAPVITSNISSMPEAAGEAAILINPENVLELTNSIQKIINDDKLASSLSQRGLEQTKKFSWEMSAISTIKIFKKLS